MQEIVFPILKFGSLLMLVAEVKVCVLDLPDLVHLQKVRVIVGVEMQLRDWQHPDVFLRPRCDLKFRMIGFAKLDA